jgi:hypothetical protein
MKARDLAALAALGIAGKMAYDKFGNKKKDEPAKTPAAKKQAEQEAYDYDARAQKAELGTKGAYLDDTPEFRTKGAYLDDTPELRTKGAYLDERATPAASAASASSAYKKVKDKSSGSLSSAGGPSRYRREAGSSAAPAQTQLVYDNDAPVAQRIAALNEANGAASESARKTDALAVGSRANQAAYLEGKRNDQMAAAGSPSALATDALAVGSRANQAAYLKDKQAQALVPDYSNEGRNRAPVTALSRINETGGASTPSARATDALAVGSRANQAAYKKAQLETQAANAQAQARMMRQGSPMAASRRNAGMPGYDEAGNPISMRSMAGQRGYDEAGNKMKRGGAVKMASGGMTSSKMSKPSGASRGDGIAQRGRTRGTLR